MYFCTYAETNVQVVAIVGCGQLHLVWCTYVMNTSVRLHGTRLYQPLIKFAILYTLQSQGFKRWTTRLVTNLLVKDLLAIIHGFYLRLVYDVNDERMGYPLRSLKWFTCLVDNSSYYGSLFIICNTLLYVLAAKCAPLKVVLVEIQ